MRKKVKVAICYDFDGTLAPGNMQEHSLLPSLGIKPSKFWSDVKKFAREKNMNEILAYMYLTIQKAKTRGHPIRKENFIEHGKSLKLFDGVDSYFDKINEYARDNNILVEHYIISSGLKEIIQGNEISKKFKLIYASEYYYDENGVAIWPANAIDYTAKTQYLFRINKGTFDLGDNSKINKYVPPDERYIPFSNMIYIGDGETDIPAMKMVNYQGGYSIAVYDPNKRSSKNKKSPKAICQELIKHGRASYIAPADYRSNSELVTIIKKIISKISIESDLKKHKSIKQNIMLK